MFRNTFERAWHRHLLLPACLVFMEIFIRLVAGGNFFGVGLIFTVLYSIILGVIITVLCSFASPKANRISLIVVQSVLSVWYCVQVVYHSFFGKFLILFSLGAGGTDQIIASGLVRNTVGAILSSWWVYPIMALPVAGVVVYTKYYQIAKMPPRYNISKLIIGIIAYLAVFGIGMLPSSMREVQTDAFNLDISVKSFGMLRTELMDFRCNVLGLGGNGTIEAGKIEGVEETEKEPEPIQYDPQQLDIDFSGMAEQEKNSTIASLHNYFAAETPSYKNQYTGMFKGYNLIQITAEGFSPYAIDKDLTPTLYKMREEGFNFTNFYTPIWEVSTSDGEYAATLGLLPKSGVWSYYRSGENHVLFPYSMPQQFLKDGVETVRAYHDHTYSYYHRDISHPNLGFIYKGLGNGLTGITKCWPESDVEMINATSPEYISADKRFMTYFMTVSGHLEYSFDGNSMSLKNKDLVSGLPYSNTIKAYYACNIEFDRAMEQLLKDLEAAGVAEKTVIAITPDHYPYGLEDADADNKYHYFDEYVGHSIDTTFELYKSCFLLYCKGMEPVTIDKYCCAVDILPTLNNLFDFSYDSRLLMGRDILSTADPLVIFLDRSWITDKGKYDAENKTFTLFPGQSVADEETYVASVKKIVSNKFKVSAEIIDNDYYKIATGRERLYSAK